MNFFQYNLPLYTLTAICLLLPELFFQPEFLLISITSICSHSDPIKVCYLPSSSHLSKSPENLWRSGGRSRLGIVQYLSPLLSGWTRTWIFTGTFSSNCPCWLIWETASDKRFFFTFIYFSLYILFFLQLLSLHGICRIKENNSII